MKRKKYIKEFDIPECQESVKCVVKDWLIFYKLKLAGAYITTYKKPEAFWARENLTYIRIQITPQGVLMPNVLDIQTHGELFMIEDHQCCFDEDWWKDVEEQTIRQFAREMVKRWKKQRKAIK